MLNKINKVKFKIALVVSLGLFCSVSNASQQKN